MRDILLTDLVSWLAAGLLVLLALATLAGWWSGRRQRQELRMRFRTCVQCGFIEEAALKDGKFGICAHCGGVTRRGRSRKLG